MEDLFVLIRWLEKGELIITEKGGDMGCLSKEEKMFLELSKQTGFNWHEPDQCGLGNVRISGEHLDNAFGHNKHLDPQKEKPNKEFLIHIEKNGNVVCTLNLAILLMYASRYLDERQCNHQNTEKDRHSTNHVCLDCGKVLPFNYS